MYDDTLWEKMKEAHTLKQEETDAISRQAVIDAIYANGVWENEYNLTSSRIKKAVEVLPSVTPAEKVGHWIDVDRIWFKCSGCGANRKMMPAYKEYYCPNCGAKMESEG